MVKRKAKALMFKLCLSIDLCKALLEFVKH